MDNNADLPDRMETKVAMNATSRPESLVISFVFFVASVGLFLQLDISSSIKVLQHDKNEFRQATKGI